MKKKPKKKLPPWMMEKPMYGPVKPGKKTMTKKGGR